MRRSRTLGGYTLRNGLFVPSLIKSIQRGTISLTGTSNTATIGAVNLSNAVLRRVGNTTVNGSGAATRIRIALTNATTVTANRDNDGGGTTVAVQFEVTEYAPGVIQSIQRGTIALTAPAVSNTATIAGVNVNRTELRSLGASGTAINNAELDVRLELTDSSTVTAVRETGVDNATASYEVVQWF